MRNSLACDPDSSPYSLGGFPGGPDSAVARGQEDL